MEKEIKYLIEDSFGDLNETLYDSLEEVKNELECEGPDAETHIVHEIVIIKSLRPTSTLKFEEKK